MRNHCCHGSHEVNFVMVNILTRITDYYLPAFLLQLTSDMTAAECQVEWFGEGKSFCIFIFLIEIVLDSTFVSL